MKIRCLADRGFQGVRTIGRSVYYQCLNDINRIEPTIASTTAPLGGICLEYCGTQECPPGHMWEGYRKKVTKITDYGSLTSPDEVRRLALQI